MSFSFKKSAFMAGAALAAIAMPISANAGALLQYGPSFLGVNDQGHLNFFAPSGPGNALPDLSSSSQPYDPVTGAGPYGIFRAGVGDATSPGCTCEGWGIAVTTSAGDRVGAGADDSAGIFGFTDTGIFGNTSFSASSRVAMADAPIEILHNYGPSVALDTFQGQVTITNRGTEVIRDVVYRRQMDWDVPPTEFNELVTHVGVEANLESRGGNVRAAVNNGFIGGDIVNDPITPDDMIGGDFGGEEGGEFDGDGPVAFAATSGFTTFNTDFSAFGPNDHGSAFDFAFGDLNPGESRTFNIYYGSAFNQAQAESRLVDILGVDVYSLGQPDLPNPQDEVTFYFGFGGVGGVAVGSSPSVPFLPFVPVPGMFIFENPEEGGRWFDPPLSDTFRYTLEGDGDEFFTLVGVPPASFGYGDIGVYVDDLLVETLSPDEVFNFVDAGLTMVSTFELRGINPLLDVEDPDLASLFPTFLDFVGSPTQLLMDLVIDTGSSTGGSSTGGSSTGGSSTGGSSTGGSSTGGSSSGGTPVSAPGSLGLLLGGLGSLVVVGGIRRRRRG